PLYIGYSVVILLAACLFVNSIFAYFFDAPSNPESTYISALILALIISPPQAFGDVHFLSLALWAAAWAMASKYIFAIKDKHLFNPAAFGVAATALFLNQGASWWVGTLWMLPFVAVGGFLVARKIRRFDMVVVFGASVVAATIALNTGGGSLHVVQQALLYAPAVFFGTVMLTEPLTAPADRFWRILFALLAGFLFAPEVHFGSFYLTPELTLLAANLFAYIVSPKQKLILTLKERIKVAADTYEFVFTSTRKINFKAGQYLEWTLAHSKSDSRGIRRYFTIASSPTEKDFRIGVKFYKPSSSYKKALLALRPGEQIVASQLAGNFTLPANKKKKLVFIAGGIGVTPFRSMIQYLIDTKEKRDISLIYSNRSVDDIAYVDLIGRAEQEIGLQTIPIFNVPPPNSAPGEFPTLLTKDVLIKEIPDYQEREFYLSGPISMVNAFSDMLSDSGVPKRHIKKDFFPGFA
ncbi:MAG TPA: FAD-binding oxidoreductase, partial [Candidatus Paceibacterota bacterium]|nr:FAD-binding oxidoreductase [Candidatus Paceibacterota bacterium]